MYLQNDAEMEMCLVWLVCLASTKFYKAKSLNDLRRDMNIINKMIVNNNILSSISTQNFDAGKE